MIKYFQNVFPYLFSHFLSLCFFFDPFLALFNEFSYPFNKSDIFPLTIMAFNRLFTFTPLQAYIEKIRLKNG